MKDNDRDYEVGYAKPPQKNQFRKGTSGNPRGRPKGAAGLATLFLRAAREQVRITENGRPRMMSKLEAALLQLSTRAASGDLKATKELLDGCRTHELSESEAAVEHPDREKRAEVMRGLIERMRSVNMAGKISTDDAKQENEL